MILKLCKIRFKLAVVFFVLSFILSATMLYGCQDYIPVGEDFDPFSFYAANSVEIAAGDRSGTGIIIGGTQRPVIASNFHVTGKDGANIRVRFFGETGFVNENTIVNQNIITVLAYDESLDLCIFEVDYVPTTVYNNLVDYKLDCGESPLAERALPSIGTRVLGLGNALGGGMIAMDGIVSMPERVVTTQITEPLPLIQTTLPIKNGCSGGAMFDEYGRLLGMTSFVGGEWSGFSFSIPVSFICKIYKEAIAHRSGMPLSRPAFDVYLVGQASHPFNARLNFPSLGIKIKVVDNDMVIFESSKYAEAVDCRITAFGEAYAPDSFSDIIAASMEYSLGGSGDSLRISITKDGLPQVLDFDNCRKK